MSDTGNYPNRSDLRNLTARTATGQTYGKATEQMEAQRAVPMAPPPTETVRPRVQPGGGGPLTRMSERPEEPITAGADFGPGPNSVQAGIPMAVDPDADAIDELRAIYMAYPTPELAALINYYDRGN